MNTNNDEIDLREVIRVLWAGKWLIGSIAFAATIIAVVAALQLPNIYRAEAILAPNQDEGTGRMAALAGQYGGLASLAGIELSSGSSDKTALGLEILRSRKFISNFIQRHDILVPLMAADGWDLESRELRINSNIYDVATKNWVRKVSPSGNVVPSLQEAYEEFSRILSISQDNKTGFVTLAIEHYSPITAQQWVAWLVEDINSTIMKQDVEEAEQSIEYLNRQIAATSLADMQNVFFRLIEEQIKTVMLAKISDEYLLTTLDPAVIPEKRLKPRRSLIVIFSMMLGIFVGIFVVAVSNRYLN